MAGNTNFPTGLDDDASLHDVTNNVTAIDASHHNDIKEAVKALEAKLGINDTADVNSIDWRLGHPTNSHSHNGATGQAQRINPTTIAVPSGGLPVGGNLHDHLMNATLHNPSALLATGIATMLAPALIRVPSQAILRATGIASIVSQSDATVLIFVPSAPTVISRFTEALILPGSVASGINQAIPVSFGRTMQLENVRVTLRVGTDSATLVGNIRFGPTSLWQASLGNRPMLAPNGATVFGHASPNLITYPSGAVIRFDVDEAADPNTARDLSAVLVFRE